MGKDVFNKNERVSIDVTQDGGSYQLSKIDFYINNYYVGSSNKNLFLLVYSGRYKQHYEYK